MAKPLSAAAALETIRRELRDYIGMNFLYDGTTAGLDDNASLAEEGIVDPTGVLELVLWIEEAYDISIGENDLGPENFDSIDNLAGYIYRRLSDD